MMCNLCTKKAKANFNMQKLVYHTWKLPQTFVYKRLKKVIIAPDVCLHYVVCFFSLHPPVKESVNYMVNLR